MKTSSMRLLGLFAALVLVGMVACQEGDEDVAEPSPTLTPDQSSSSPEPAVTNTPSDALGTPDESPTQVSPDPGSVQFRWGQITILVPDEEFAVTRYRAYPEGLGAGRPVLCFAPRDAPANPGGVCLDAEDGTILRDDTADFQREAIDAVLGSVRIGEGESDPPPWPLGVQDPEMEKTGGKVRFWQPHPASGIALSITAVEPSGAYIQIESARSVMAIDATTGDVISERTDIDPQEQESFDRWLNAVEVTQGS